ncbi:MAG: hypothetical protein QW734_07315 [Candidatus Bathyarchaeia archaeon]
MILDESIPVYVIYDKRYAPEKMHWPVFSLMDVHFKIFLDIEKFKKSPRYFPTKTYVLSRKYYKKLKNLIGDNAMEIERFEEMIRDLTILTDGENLFSLSKSQKMPAIKLPIELSKLIYDEFGCATVVYDPMSTIDTTSYGIPEEVEGILFLQSSGYLLNGLTKKMLLRHYGKKEVRLDELIESNEEFMTKLIKKYDTMHANIAFDRYEIHNIRIPNVLFPTSLLNPRNSVHREALIVHKLAEHGVDVLVLYSRPNEISEHRFKYAMMKLQGHTDVISMLPEEAQLRALTLL